MNSYDYQALRAIRKYHKEHGSYPKFVEATAEYRAAMACAHFELPDVPLLPTDEVALIENASTLLAAKRIAIPVVALGTCDIVYRGLFLQSADINLEQAKCKTQEKFHRLGAKFARAGCLLLEPKSNWGQQDSPPFLFYARIEVFVFGEQGAFDVVMAEGYNHSPDEQ